MRRAHARSSISNPGPVFFFLSIYILARSVCRRPKDSYRDLEKFCVYTHTRSLLYSGHIRVCTRCLAKSFSPYVTHMIFFIRLPPFPACNIRKLRGAWGRGYSSIGIYISISFVSTMASGMYSCMQCSELFIYRCTETKNKRYALYMHPTFCIM